MAAVGLKTGQGIVWSNTKWLGLRARMRRARAPRGGPVRREVQIGWLYTHAAVAIDPMTGRLWHARQKNMKGGTRARIWGA